MDKSNNGVSYPTGCKLDNVKISKYISDEWTVVIHSDFLKNAHYFEEILNYGCLCISFALVIMYVTLINSAAQ